MGGKRDAGSTVWPLPTLDGVAPSGSGSRQGNFDRTTWQAEYVKVKQPDLMATVSLQGVDKHHSSLLVVHDRGAADANATQLGWQMLQVGGEMLFEGDYVGTMEVVVCWGMGNEEWGMNSRNRFEWM